MSVLALDLGTSRIKAVLAGWDGRIRATRGRLTPTLSDGAGQLAFPAAAVRDVALSLVAQLTAAQPEDPVDTLVFSCLGTAMVPLDARGQPLGPALAPADVRPSGIPGLVERLGLDRDTHLALTGQDPRLSSFLHHWLWWQAAHPEVTRRLHRFRSLRGFLVAGLCGADAEDASWASRTGLMDLASDTWSDTILDAGGLPGEVLPPIGRSTAAWPVDPVAGARLGLQPGAKVVLGAMDNCCAVFGASDPAEPRLVNIAGTYEHMAGAGTLELTRSAAQAVDGLVHRFLLPGAYLSLSRVAVGHLLAEVEQAAPAGLGPLMEAVHETPTGRRIALEVDAVRRALADGVAPADVLQALMESSAVLLGRYAGAWVAAGGRVDRIVVVGGGAAHARVLQLKANCLGRPVSTLDLDEGAALGALRVAAIAVRGASPEDACRLFADPVAGTWWPNPRAAT
jgi:xylulokinase